MHNGADIMRRASYSIHNVGTSCSARFEALGHRPGLNSWRKAWGDTQFVKHASQSLCPASKPANLSTLVRSRLLRRAGSSRSCRAALPLVPPGRRPRPAGRSGKQEGVFVAPTQSFPAFQLLSAHCCYARSMHLPGHGPAVPRSYRSCCLFSPRHPRLKPPSLPAKQATSHPP